MNAVTVRCKSKENMRTLEHCLAVEGWATVRNDVNYDDGGLPMLIVRTMGKNDEQIALVWSR